MLFNHHEEQFKIKNSFESRLFNPSSLNNLDEVMNDLKEAVKCCVKLPEVNFVIFYKPDSTTETNSSLPR